MARVAVFGGPSLKRRLKGLRGSLEYAFFPLPGPASPGPGPGSFEGALIEVGKGVGALGQREDSVYGRLKLIPVDVVKHRLKLTVIAHS